MALEFLIAAAALPPGYLLMKAWKPRYGYFGALVRVAIATMAFGWPIGFAVLSIAGSGANSWRDIFTLSLITSALPAWLLWWLLKPIQQAEGCVER